VTSSRRAPLVDAPAMRSADIPGAPAMLAFELARLNELERVLRQLLAGGHITPDGTVTLSVSLPIAEWEDAIRLLSPTG
jgi:hypothetical protein